MRLRCRSSAVLQLLALVLAGGMSAPAATYYVNSISALATRINAAIAGDEIVLSNGVYATSASIGIARAGTAANRIVIRAETIGGRRQRRNESGSREPD